LNSRQLGNQNRKQSEEHSEDDQDIHFDINTTHK